MTPPPDPDADTIDIPRVSDRARLRVGNALAMLLLGAVAVMMALSTHL